MSRYYLCEQVAEQYGSSTDYAREFLFNALNIGEEMLVSGAEVSRVENSIKRICMAYGAEKVDVFSITSAIFVTVYSPMFGAVTQTRRITSARYDLYKLSRLNELARRICDDMPLFEEVIWSTNRAGNTFTGKTTIYFIAIFLPGHVHFSIPLSLHIYLR